MPAPIEQLLSRTVYDTDGSTTVWDFSFASGYLDPSHVKAYTTDSLGAQTDIVVTAPMLIGEFQLQITPALADGLVLTIYRDTPKDAPLVNFVDETSFSELALDTNAKQAVMVAAEAIDTVNSSDIQGAIDAASNAAAAAVTATAAAVTASTNALSAQSAAISAAAFAASINPAGFATAAQGVKADSALQLVSLTGATTKATPVDADQFTFLDSAASFGLKKLTWANIKSVLSALFALRGANSDITSLAGLTTPLSIAQGGTGSTAGAVLLTGAQTVAGVKTFSNAVTMGSASMPTPSGSAPLYACRAWAYFNGTTAGTNAPQAGGNVTSITRNSVGNYTANFTTAMPDAFISLSGSSVVSTVVCLISSTTTSVTFSVNGSSSGGAVDASTVNVQFIR